MKIAGTNGSGHYVKRSVLISSILLRQTFPSRLDPRLGTSSPSVNNNDDVKLFPYPANVRTNIITLIILRFPESSCNVQVDDQSRGMSGGAIAAVAIISVFVITAISGGLVFMRIRRIPREGMRNVFEN